MKKLLITFIVLTMSNTSTSQSISTNFDDFISELFHKYHHYKVKDIETKRFIVNDYHKILDSLIVKSNKLFSIDLIGKSFKQKEIKLIQFGNGVRKILMWSQMHGDESTASLALLDVINFLNNERHFAQYFSDKISLYIIPILNPDGAKEFERRNSQEIDINRDALRLQTPEGKILKQICDNIKPEFAFNLHDQYSSYSVGKTGRPASIAVLAPPFDYDRSINEVRKKSMQVCVEIKKIVEKFYPGVVARYDDEFEPRAFGDNIQMWGSSTILIESGGYFKDFEKQEVRKMNFLSLLGSIYSIANNLYEKNSIQSYFEIPENERRFFDLLIRNVIVEKDSIEYLIDLGITYTEKFDSLRNKYIRQYSIVDIGDLSTFFAFDTLEANQLKLELGKVFEKVITNPRQLKKLNPQDLLSEGITTIIYQGAFKDLEQNSLLDLMITTTKFPLRESRKLLNHSANFVLKDNNGKIIYAVVNGNVIKIR
ncbi:MAG: M14 family zinc carboxypeptidase [Ignavibacteria bacterium]|nr:M14 family zinc carboxypeptidase [Ignavibacteria bacterium]